MSSKGSYPYSSFNTLYAILNCSVPFYLTQFNSTSWANLISSFAFSEGEISSLKWSAAILSPMDNKADYNEQNTQALLFSCKTYYFGESGNDFFIICFCMSRRGFKGSVYWRNKTSRIKIWLLILEICIDPLLWYFKRFCYSTEEFSFEKKTPITYLMQYLDNLCVPIIVYWNFLNASLCVALKIIFDWL